MLKFIQMSITFITFSQLHNLSRFWTQITAHLVCKQTLCHTAVSIVQIPVWCLDIHWTLVRYATLRHIRDASGARQLIDGSDANKRSFTLSRRHSLRLRCSVHSRLYYVTLHWPA